MLQALMGLRLLRRPKKKEAQRWSGWTGQEPSMIKSNFSLEFKYSEWMNSRMYFSLVRLDPFYKEF